MRIVSLGEPRVIMENPTGRHNYFAWPTVARLKNGRLAVAASGFRMRHICPFGKTVLAFSDDNGETYTAPAPVIDTVLDDRDGGVTPFGESGVVVTSFNHTVEFQRQYAETPYDHAYLDTITPEEEAAALGATFRISHDNGVTFGPICKCPVTSPHGPVELPDGTLLWVGRTYSEADVQMPEKDCIRAYAIHQNGTTEFVGEIANIQRGDLFPLSCEPHAIVLPDGRILVHIRVQKSAAGLFTVFQSESCDGGKTWSAPRQLLSDDGGSPPHVLCHSSGVLVCTYGYRAKKPFGVKAMFSRDNGETWDVDHVIYSNHASADLGYPSTVELPDGSLLTVFYAHSAENAPAVILQQRWRFEE